MTWYVRKSSVAEPPLFKAAPAPNVHGPGADFTKMWLSAMKKLPGTGSYYR